MYIYVIYIYLSLSGNKLTTDLHTKSTDKHRYLH